MDLLQRLNREQQQTIVMVTHDPAVGARADRIVRFRDGQIVPEVPGDGAGPSSNGLRGVDLVLGRH